VDGSSIPFCELGKSRTRLACTRGVASNKSSKIAKVVLGELTDDSMAQQDKVGRVLVMSAVMSRKTLAILLVRDEVAGRPRG
jgi:hypothetical protein